MDYKRISSEAGGKAPQFKGVQPHAETRTGTAIPCPPRVPGAPKLPHRNPNCGDYHPLDRVPT